MRTKVKQLKFPRDLSKGPKVPLKRILEPTGRKFNFKKSNGEK